MVNSNLKDTDKIMAKSQKLGLTYHKDEDEIVIMNFCEVGKSCKRILSEVERLVSLNHILDDQLNKDAMIFARYSEGVASRLHQWVVNGKYWEDCTAKEGRNC